MADSERIEPGERLRLKRAVHIDASPRLYLKAPDGSTTPLGTLSTSLRWTAGTPGQYEIWTTPDPPDSIVNLPDDVTRIASYTVENGDGNSGEETVGNPDDWTNVDNSDEIDPSNHRWIVNADNEEGIAPAPALRRQGVELGPNGATFRLPNGETVDVGAIEDADEVARIIDEDSDNSGDVGDVIDADQPTVDDGANESNGSNTPSSGDLGAGGAVLAALALAYLIYRRQ